MGTSLPHFLLFSPTKNSLPCLKHSSYQAPPASVHILGKFWNNAHETQFFFFNRNMFFSIISNSLQLHSVFLIPFLVAVFITINKRAKYTTTS